MIDYIKVHAATKWTIRHSLMLLLYSAHAPLNHDDGGLLPDAYLHLVRKKRPLISDHIKGPLVTVFRSPLMKALDRNVETLGLWIVTSSVTFIKTANQSSIKLCQMIDSYTDTLISCLCVICAIHLFTPNRTCWGNATGVPRQKKFGSKASGWYYNSLVYFLNMP